MARGRISSRLRRQPRINMRESSSDESDPDDFLEETESDDSDDSDVEFQSSQPIARASTRNTTPAGRPAKRQRITPSPKKASSKPRTPRATISRPNPRPAEPEIAIDPSKIPPWTTLPYQVLHQIFDYATYPRKDTLCRATKGTKQLLELATLNRSFTEPALSVLYHDPPLPHEVALSQFQEALAAVSETSTINYRVKVQSLNLLIDRTFLPFTTRLHGNMRDVFQYTPNLKSLHLTCSTDQIEYHKNQFLKFSESRLSNVYTYSLLDSLEANKIFLRNWSWSFACNRAVKPASDETNIPHAIEWSDLHTIHARPVFSYLTSLEVYKLDSACFEVIPEAADLSSLKHFGFTLCDFEDSTLDWLPQNLHSLALRDCPNIDSDTVRSFLRNGGLNLKSIYLAHNLDLSLDFLSSLGVYAPNLRIFEVDLTYTSTLLSVANNEPRYDEALKRHSVPIWPAALEHLEILHLRKWSAETAQSFFQSLIDQADHLTFLRKIILKASVEVNWRDRAKFREEWVDALHGQFLRKAPPPVKNDTVAPAEKNETVTVTARRSVRAAAERDSKVKAEQSQSQSQSQNAAGRRGKRAENEGIALGPTPRTDFVQGLCDVVDLRIDNLRPMEGQLNEGDFLDSERSGDEEYID